MFFVSMKELGSMMDSRRINMLQIFNYNAGKGDCLRLRYTGASGISHKLSVKQNDEVCIGRRICYASYT